MITKKGEGTFSEVIKAISLKTNKYVAIKCMKSQFKSLEQVVVGGRHIQNILGEQIEGDTGIEEAVSSRPYSEID